MENTHQVKVLINLLAEAQKEIKQYRKIVEDNLQLNTDKYQLKLWEDRKKSLDEELQILYKILEQRNKKNNLK
jgi:hypothetical protein